MALIYVNRTVDIGEPIETESLPGSLFSVENQAHCFVIECITDGDPVTLSGTITGYFIRHANNSTLTLSGSISNGRAQVTLPRDCYNLAGRFTPTILCTSGGATTAIYSAVGEVRKSSSGVIVDSGNVLPGLEDYQEAYEQVLAATADALAAAEEAQGSTTGAVRFDISQSLTDAQKNTARNNISAVAASTLNSYLQTANIANNLTTTASGKALDARQGAALKALIDACLPLSGGTMTGNINMGQAGESTVSGQVTWTTSDGVTFRLRSYADYLQLARTTSDGTVNSGVIRFNSDGTVYITNPSAWRDALGSSSGVWPSSLGGTGQTSLQATRNAMGLGNTTGALPVANGGTGLAASPSMLVNLASTLAANVMQASPRPGVTGTLPVTNGGTGATTPAGARSNLGITPANIGALPVSGGTMTGNIDMGQSGDQTYSKRIAWTDKDGAQFLLGAFDDSLQLVRTPAGSSSGVSLMRLYSDGTVYVPATAWRNALGLGNTSGAVPVANGGTGATTASAARTNLGITPANIGAFGLAAITTPTDLNDTGLIGRTFVDRTSCSHCPSASYQYYYVLLFGVVQVAFAHASTGIPMMYVRHYTNSQWYPWRSIATSAVS